MWWNRMGGRREALPVKGPQAGLAGMWNLAPVSTLGPFSPGERRREIGVVGLGAAVGLRMGQKLPVSPSLFLSTQAPELFP